MKARNTQENYSTLSRARQFLNSKDCWKSCYDCEKDWSSSGTANVHLISLAKSKDGRAKTRFICDTCLGEYKYVVL